MALGIEGFGDDLTSPKLGTTQGPGAYDRLIQVMRALRDDEVLLGPLGSAWQGRRFETVYARPLLLLAALRFRALCDAQHPLGFEALMDAQAPDLEGRFRAAMSDPELGEVLRTRSIQTNEPGRAFAWGLPALVLQLGHRAFSLIDVGCSAGLNLVVDRTAIEYRFGMNKVSGFDFPSPERRVGLDVAPIDVRDEVESRWLEACIWPGQPERLARYAACRDVYRKPWQGASPAPLLERHELGQGETLTRLEEAAGELPTIAYESVVRPYLSEAERARHDECLARFIGGGRSRMWAVLEPNERPQGTTPMTLTVHLSRGGEVLAIPLAESGYHSASCVIVPGAVARLQAAWSG
jgi:hypothetical protein